MVESEYYFTPWFVNVVEVKRGLALSFAYCPVGKGPCFITLTGKKAGFSNVIPGIVNDIIVDFRGCSDGKWCINLECKYNKVRKSSPLDFKKNFEKYGIKTIEDVKETYKTLCKILDQLDVNIPNGERPCIISFDKPPFRKERRR